MPDITKYLDKLEFLNDLEMVAMVLALAAVCFALIGIFLTISLRSKSEPAPSDSSVPEAAEEPVLFRSNASDDGVRSLVPRPSSPVPLNPRVSVLVHATNSAEAVLDYLEQLERQTYTIHETILIYEDTAEAAHHLNEMVTARYPNVRLTFMPLTSRNISRRKMSLTLGMKAASADIVLTTASNCVIPSDTWLEEMMAPFANEETDIVLGYSSMDFDELTGIGRWYRQFDSVITAATWINAALAKHPYRGDGYNLAFRKKLFFDHKGYANSVFLHYGDDDLFINEIANKGNTEVVLTPSSRLTTKWGRSANRIWTDRKEHYAFTQRWLPKIPFLRNALNSWMNWLVLLCGAGAITLSILAFIDGTGIITLGSSLESLFPVAGVIALAAMIVYWNLETVAYRRTAATLGATKLWVTVVPFMLWRPIGNLIFRIRHRSHSYTNYTWQRHRSAYIVDFFRQRLRRARHRSLLRKVTSRQ